MSISIQHTLNFIKEFAANAETSILEVGCGAGRLALEMQQYGYQVKAIDVSKDAVQKAQALGVDAEEADVLNYTCEKKFDFVLFTHSLHHIRPLETVMNKVKSLLGERGRILVEDFTLEVSDERTLSWYFEMKDFLSTLVGREIHTPDKDEGPVERWKRSHVHEPPLHTSKDMLKVMERHFGNVHTANVPFLYRSFEFATSQLPNGETALQRLFDWELRLIEKGQIQPVGLRIAAKKYFSYLR